jgi:hypothetical protein
LFNAIAAPSIDAPKRSSWCRIRVTRSARSAEPRWNRGRKAPTFRFTNLLNALIRGWNDQRGKGNRPNSPARPPVGRHWLIGLSVRQLISGHVRCGSRSRHQEAAGIWPRKCAGSSAARRPRAARLRQARWAAGLHKMRRCGSGAFDVRYTLNSGAKFERRPMSDLGSRLCVARRPKHEDNDRSVRSRNGPGAV